MAAPRVSRFIHLTFVMGRFVGWCRLHRMCCYVNRGWREEPDSSAQEAPARIFQQGSRH